MKRDREPVVQGIAVHYQPQCHLLEDRIVLVIGTSNGVGRKAALTYVRHNASIALPGYSDEKLRAIVQETEHKDGFPVHWFIPGLLTCTPQACQQLAQQIGMRYPRLDGVLHSAGLPGDIYPMGEQRPEVWQQVMWVNVNGTLMLTQALLPLLLHSDVGSLVFISSSAGRQDHANQGAYTVSRFATEGMMQVPADEYQSRHLRMNCINPSGIRTRIHVSTFPTEDPLELKTPADVMPIYL